MNVASQLATSACCSKFCPVPCCGSERKQMFFLYSYLTRVPCASPLSPVLKKKATRSLSSDAQTANGFPRGPASHDNQEGLFGTAVYRPRKTILIDRPKEKSRFLIPNKTL